MLTVHIGPMILDLTDSLSVCLLINVKFPTSAQRQALGALIFLVAWKLCVMFSYVYILHLWGCMWVHILDLYPHLLIEKAREMGTGAGKM